VNLRDERPVTQAGRAVFPSYASQDAEAALQLCNALRKAGVEVWFDQSELRGGDAWDASIRRQIKTCALFLPVISRNTHDRVEGYFRLEWKLAVDRSHLIAADQAFLLPVVVDDTRDDDERVPERFREVQWTRLPGGVAPTAFVERVRRVLSGELSQGPTRSTLEAARVPAASTIPNDLGDKPSRVRGQRRGMPGNEKWSGRWESNPRLKLGKLGYYHYTTPAWRQILVALQGTRQISAEGRRRSRPASPAEAD
jgi:hypothetical protein